MHATVGRNIGLEKMIKTRAALVCLLAVLWSFVSGCTTLADAKLARGTGTSRVYPVNPEVVWRVLPDVVASSGLDYVDGNPSAGYALAQHGINLLSYGENVAIFVQPGNAASTTLVEVVSKRAMATNVLATNWEHIILDGLSTALARYPSVRDDVPDPGMAAPGRDGATGTAQYPTSANITNGVIRPGQQRAPSAYASVVAVDAVPYLDMRGRDAYRAWLSRGSHRAFAISADGHWGWASEKTVVDGNSEAASDQALNLCRKLSHAACAIYAVDDRVIWQGATGMSGSR